MVWDPVTRQATVFDTGWYADDIFALVELEDLKVEHLMITHMHGDHVAAMGDVHKHGLTFGCTQIMRRSEKSRNTGRGRD